MEGGGPIEVGLARHGGVEADTTCRTWQRTPYSPVGLPRGGARGCEGGRMGPSPHKVTEVPASPFTLYGEGPEPATVRFRSTKRMNSSASAIRVFQSAPPPTRVAYARS